jgi:hypothetical protein
MTTNELTFDALHSQEILSLETANNVYRFCITDAPNFAGILSGGIFGECSTKASFLSAVSSQEDYQTEDFGKVKIGSRAIFVYQTAKGIHHLVTSPIIKLVHSTETPQT